MGDDVILDLPELKASANRPASVVLVGAWPDQHEALAAHVTSVVGASPPSDAATAVIFDGGCMFRVHPDKLLIVAPRDATIMSRFQSGYSPEIGSLSDQGHSRVLLTLSGDALWPVLAQGLPMDPEYALPGTKCFVQTRLQDANILAHRKGPQSVTLMVPTSFAHAVSEWVRRAAENITK